MSYFYNGTTKSYIIAFSKLFSDVHIKRVDAVDTEVKDVKVPLVYASKQKLSYKLQNVDDSISIVLPVIGFNIESIEYDPVRKLNSLNEIRVNDSQYVFEGLPYNYNFSVTIKTKYQDDMWQILEQVLYYFKPGTSLNVKELPFSTDNRDILVNLLGTDLNFETNYGEQESRELEANLQFALKGYIYPSVSDDKIINEINIDFVNKLDIEILSLSHDFINPDNIIVNINHKFVDPDIVTNITEY